MTEYVLHPEALTDIEEIWDFIAESSIDAADRVIEDIRRAIRLLVQAPHQGHRRIDLTSRPLRFLRVHSYLIAYAPDERPLLVIALLHGRRNPRVMAAILRGREPI
jgi:plasmid stabilization system protein ParE